MVEVPLVKKPADIKSTSPLISTHLTRPHCAGWRSGHPCGRPFPRFSTSVRPSPPGLTLCAIASLLAMFYMTLVKCMQWFFTQKPRR